MTPKVEAALLEDTSLFIRRSLNQHRVLSFMMSTGAFAFT